VGTGQYYCWNCLHEFTMQGHQGFTAYYVDEEGSLVSVAELAFRGPVREENLLG
jgi:hypothetical protein